MSVRFGHIGVCPMPEVSAPAFMVRFMVRNGGNRWAWTLQEGSEPDPLAPGGNPWLW